MLKSFYNLYCPKCKSKRIHRKQRKGVLQEKILPFLGFFPYKCRDCNNRFYLKVRDVDRRGKPMM